MNKKLLPLIVSALLLADVRLHAAPAVPSTTEPIVYPSRQFLPPPPPGVHPRVLFSPDEMPALLDRLHNTPWGKSMVAISVKAVEQERPLLEALAALQHSELGSEVVRKYWIEDERRNQAFFQAAIIGLVKDDPSLCQLSINATMGYCQVIEKARALDLDISRGKLQTGIPSKSDATWGSTHWDLGTGWVNGGLGLALTYDMLFNKMTHDQQDYIRQTLSDITSHRRSFDMEDPKTHQFYPGRIMTNWALYHGALPLMALAIEGEKGYDPEIYKIWQKMVPLYLHQAIYPSGGSGEDSYPLGTSLRESGPLMIAMARRGENLFTDLHYQRFWTMVAQSLEPFPGGGFIGGSGGGGSARTEGGAIGYAGSWVCAHYGVPTSPVINYLWRRYVGDHYNQHMAWQSYIPELLFCTAWDASIPGSDDPSQLGLPKTAYYPGRGLWITRSDWGADALDVHLDGRADAFLVGHDTVDRGNFTVTALGKTWAPYPDWMGFMYGDEHSLVQIDGRSEAWKAPSVKFVATRDDEQSSMAAVDLKYAYDWQWPPPWPAQGQTFPAPWEKEPSDPRELGLPDEPDFAWIPHQLYDHPEVGFNGLNFWRKPYNPVQKCFRTLLMVRGRHPYLLVADDVKKDNATHSYQWFLQLDVDVTLLKQEQDGAILAVGDGTDRRRLLVRAIPPRNGWSDAPIKIELQHYLGKATPGKGALVGQHIAGERLIVSRDGVIEPQFKLLIVPFSEGDALPASQWASKDTISIRWSDGADQIGAAVDETGRTALALQ
jgi:hypothetical protein